LRHLRSFKTASKHIKKWAKAHCPQLLIFRLVGFSPLDNMLQHWVLTQ